MFSIIQGSFKKLIRDKLGVHIVERLIVCFDEELVFPLYQLLLEKFVSYSNNETTLCLVILYFNTFF